MPQRFQLADPAAEADLDTYLGRAAAAHDGPVRDASVRVIVAGAALAVYVPVLLPAGLLDDSATVLGLRVFGLREPGDEVDTIVPIAGLRDRLAAAAGGAFELGAPTPVYAVSWAGIVPPRGGWTPIGEVDAAELRDSAIAGIEEVATAIPARAGDPIVHGVRAHVWGAPLPGAERLPRGAALAAHALGFLPPSGTETATIHEVGPWGRLTLRRGHVLVKRRAWSLAG